jgi:hypothetical protein
MTMATEQAKQKNGKFIGQGEQYGTHAIELIEGNKKPASMDDATWKEYRDLLPRLYQSMGILGMVRGDRAATQTRLSKATELDPKDPFNYLLLTGSVNDEYQDAAKKYQGMKDGPEKTAELQKVIATLDRVIDAYASFHRPIRRQRAVSYRSSAGNAGPENYYKYRHNGKTDGMQELINKYKRLQQNRRIRLNLRLVFRVPLLATSPTRRERATDGLTINTIESFSLSVKSVFICG